MESFGPLKTLPRANNPSPQELPGAKLQTTDAKGVMPGWRLTLRGFNLNMSRRSEHLPSIRIYMAKNPSKWLNFHGYLI